MKIFLRWSLATSIAAIILVSGGNRHDPWLWAYVAVFALVGGYAIASMDESLVRERFHPPDRGADRLSLRGIRLVALLHVIAAILDSRFGWTHVPPMLRGVGLVGFALSFLLIVKAMRTNRFFSAVVRIQDDRGHHLVDSGPYSIVRHPGYAGMIPSLPMSALALGSWVSVLFALAYSALILRRVAFEDSFLHANLPGYTAYASRVRARLLPGLW
ncbi:MAG: isoprenylcysteine carboxylmethyltransferase family protein [Acidobacteria bacterium]|nr:isoprenylcysteine carboxylmethyltransferase family protein [Acidobacteriota bacterium]